MRPALARSKRRCSMRAKPKYGYGSGMILRTAMDRQPYRRGVPLAERIIQSSMPVTECGCWIWLASGNRDGFGTIRGIGNVKTTAHRASWTAFRGPIPKGLLVRHMCDIPLCVNPDHLALGTTEQNAADRSRRRRFKNVWLWGTTLTPSPVKRRLTIIERLEQHYIPEPNSGCWIWCGAGLDYGCLRLGNRTARAHRVSWEAHRGPIPEGLEVLHRCDIGYCINPDHLSLGTHADNMRDRSLKGRVNAIRGTDVNTAKISEREVRLIRASKEAGPALAKAFGVGLSQISRIRRRESWRHVQ